MNSDPAGQRDAQRVLDLLWGRRPPPSRGPRPGLTLEQIVVAAIDVADEEGLPGLAMHRVAERVGVTPMALYRYVPGKAELHELMLDVVLGETNERTTVNGDWRARLTWWAEREAAIYRRHPWVLQLPIGNPPLGPNAIGLLDWVLEAVSEIGLSGGEMMDVVTLVTSYIRGQAELMLSVEQATGPTETAGESWVTAYTQLLEGVVDRTAHPTLAALVEHGDLADPARVSEQAFRFGLACILDGVQALVHARAAERRA